MQTSRRSKSSRTSAVPPVRHSSRSVESCRSCRRTTTRMPADSWRSRRDSSSCTSSLMSRTTRGSASRRRSMTSLIRSTVLRRLCRLGLTMRLPLGDKSSKIPRKTSRFSPRLSNSRTGTYLGLFNSSFKSSQTLPRSWKDLCQTTASRFPLAQSLSTTDLPLAALREACVERNFIYHKLTYIYLSTNSAYFCNYKMASFFSKYHQLF